MAGPDDPKPNSPAMDGNHADTRNKNVTTKLLASTLLAATTLLLPLPTLASDCAHVRDIDLSFDVSGVQQVRFEIGPHDLDVQGTQAATAATVRGRACASSESALDGLRVTHSRRGDTVVVRLERGDGATWTLFGSRYARLDLAADLPRNVRVVLDIGSGDGSATGVAALEAHIGSGDLAASNVAGLVSLAVGSGDADLKDIGALRVDAIGSGDVTASRVRGDASVGSIGSGDFDLYGAGGDVEIGSVGSGDAGMRNVGGTVRVGSVGSGDIDALDVSGDLVVRSVGSGGIHHRGIGGRVDLPADH